jgi:hypothetical protein
MKRMNELKGKSVLKRLDNRRRILITITLIFLIRMDTTLAASVTLDSPLDSTITSPHVVQDFTSTAIEDGSDLVNASLEIWDNTGSLWRVNFTDSVASGVPVTLSMTMDVTGIYLWNYRFYDKDNNAWTAPSNYTFYPICDSECQSKSPGGWLGYKFEHSGFEKIEIIFDWSNRPREWVGLYSALSHFWFESGQGGYTGPQIEVSKDGKKIVTKVLWSIWSMNNQEFTVHPYPPDSSWCTYGTGEGYFVQCMLRSDSPARYYDWEEGNEYKITVQRDLELPDGVVWNATIEDMETGQKTLIGRMKLDDVASYEGYGLINWNNGGFLEYYGGIKRCLEAEYGKIIRKGIIADGIWLPRRGSAQYSECVTSLRYSPEPGVIIEEYGKGVVRYPPGPTAPTDIILWEYDHDIKIGTTTTTSTTATTTTTTLTATTSSTTTTIMEPIPTPEYSSQLVPLIVVLVVTAAILLYSERERGIIN